MVRMFEGGRLVVASHNPGKVREINDLLRPFGVEAISAGDLNLPEPEETGSTFAENAILKATAAAEASGLPALSDDSGLAVNALDGAPGIYSARWAGPEKNFGIAMKRVNTELAGQGRPPRAIHLRALPRLAGQACGGVRGQGGRGDFLAAGGDKGLRLRSDLQARWPHHHFRRDGAGKETRHEPPRARVRATGSGVFPSVGQANRPWIMRAAVAKRNSAKAARSILGLMV